MNSFDTARVLLPINARAQCSVSDKECCRGNEGNSYTRAGRYNWGGFLSGEDYEIRFLNADGSVSLLLVTNSTSYDHALEVALKKFATEMKAFEVWRGQTLVAKGPAKD